MIAALFLAFAQADPNALARRAYDAATAGNHEAAIADLREAARLAPRNALYRSALGGVHERLGKHGEAAAEFAEAARLDPSNAGFRARLENAMLEHGAELARARRYRAGLTLALDAAKRFPASAPVHQMLGLFETRNQRNVSAAAAYRRALELNPSSGAASVGLGIALSGAGLDKEARAAFEAGIARFQKDPAHRQAYGVFLAKSAEPGSAAAARAAEMLESALAIDPNLAEASYQLGNLALAQEDAVSAAAHFDAAGRNGLDDSRLHWAKARALRRLGQTAAAEKHLELFRARKRAEETASGQP